MRQQGEGAAVDSTEEEDSAQGSEVSVEPKKLLLSLEAWTST